MQYFEWILGKSSFFAGEFFSAADISIASAFTIRLFRWEINWVNYEKVKNWYAAIKSRPSFKEILEESIYNIAPATH